MVTILQHPNIRRHLGPRSLERDYMSEEAHLFDHELTDLELEGITTPATFAAWLLALLVDSELTISFACCH